MGIFHYLNVEHGDCSIIQHPSGHVTVVDVNNAGKGDVFVEEEVRKLLGLPGDFNQRHSPVDPVAYMKRHNITSVFRFIATHPDMDHIGGIESLFKAFSPANFWDTNNWEEKTFDGPCQWDEGDWHFYKHLRDSAPQNDPKRLVLYANQIGKYFNQHEDGTGGGDGLFILAPTKALEAAAQASGDCNEYSYVLLYRSEGGRILLSGDSHDATWEHILANHRSEVEDVDILLAPHHGRDSGRSFDFLDVVRPRLTLFGVANSQHLAYDEWSRRGLPIITNNQANCVVLDTNSAPIRVYVTNKAFAEQIAGINAVYSPLHQAYYCWTLPAR
jgi:competence protein ComEC